MAHMFWFLHIPEAKKKHKSSEAHIAPSPGYQDWRAASGTAGRLVNSRWEVEVRSFRLLLNRLEKGRGYEVAEAVVTGLSWEMASMRGNLDVTGKLGGVLVRDLTPVGHQLYSERFVTTGNEALDFQFFRFSADDPHLARDYDVRLNINMASVLYVHTQRFYVECMSVVQQFQQLMAAGQENSPQHEKPDKSPSTNQRKQWKHGTRILLNVDAGSPVIVLPVCSRLFSRKFSCFIIICSLISFFYYFHTVRSIYWLLTWVEFPSRIILMSSLQVPVHLSYQQVVPCDLTLRHSPRLVLVQSLSMSSKWNCHVWT